MRVKVYFQMSINLYNAEIEEEKHLITLGHHTSEFSIFQQHQQNLSRHGQLRFSAHYFQQPCTVQTVERSLYQNRSIAIDVGKVSFETDDGLHGRLLF